MSYKYFFKIINRLINRHKLLCSLMVLNLFIGLVIPIMLFSYDKGLDETLVFAGRDLLGADLRVSSRIEPKRESIQKIDDILGDKVIDKSQLYSLFTMARANSKLSLIQLRYIKGEYPFYSSIKTKLGKSVSTLLPNEVIVQKDILAKFGIKPGDQITISGQAYKIVDTIEKDIGASMRFANVAPRAYLNFSKSNTEKLIQKGSTVSYRQYYKLNRPLIDEEYSSLTDQVTDSELRFTTPNQSNGTFARGIKLVLDFSQLIFICGILISVTAYFYIFKHFLELEQRNIDIYHGLGLPSRSISLIYLGYSLFCFIASMVLTFISIYALKGAFFNIFKDFIPKGVSLLSSSLEVPYMFVILLALFVTSFIVPVVYSKIKYTPVKILHWLPSVFLFLLLLVWQTKSLLWAPSFVVVLIALGTIFYFLIPYLFTPLVKSPSLVIELAMKSLVRNKGVLFTRFSMIVMTFTVINLIPIVFSALSNDLNYGKGEKPGYFLFDIQQEQVADLKSFYKDSGIKTDGFSPLVRARLLKINGKELDLKRRKLQSREEEVSRRSRNRGINLSYKGELNHSERVISGEFETRPYSGEGDIPISIEQRYAKRLGLSLGDRLEFSILDLPFNTKVTSIRSVKWTSFLPNFFILFPTGVLEDAPKTYLSTISKTSYENIIKLNEDFANVTSINVSTIMKEVSSFLNIMENVLFQMVVVFLVITFVAFFSLNYFQLKVARKSDDLFRQLGLSLSKVRNIHMFSYSILSLFSILSAFILANIMGYIILERFLNIEYVLSFKYIFLNLIPVLGLALFFKDKEKT